MGDPQPRGLWGLLAGVVETALLPLHAAVSKPAQRAYLGTFLFAATSILLLCLSSVAYTLFYYSYVPQNSVERVVYLQFGNGHHPHGTVQLSNSLTSLQPYDIGLSLHLPRTPSNLAAGNFMLDLSLLGPTSSSRASHPTTTSTNAPLLLAHSRRPAILTYSSSLIATLSTLSALPWYLLGWKSESEHLTITMFEGVEFARGTAHVPQSARVVVETATTAEDGKFPGEEEEKGDEIRRKLQMQFYEVRVHIIAKLGGLRWIMYQHRILSFLFFTTTFWSSAMMSMTLSWLVLSTLTKSSPSPSSSPDVKLEKPREKLAANGATVAIKREDEGEEEEEEDIKIDPTSLLNDLSDTPRTFPSTPGGRRPRVPLRFEGRRDILKREDVDEEEENDKFTLFQAMEADDEDEDEDEAADIVPETSGFRDSGIGTGLDEERLASVQRSLQRRRRGLSGEKRDGGGG